LLKKIIYNRYVNFCLRNFCYFFKPWLPDRLRIPVSGLFSLKISPQEKIKIYTNPTSYITKQLFWEGADNYEFTHIFKKLISHSTCFVDVGANFGYYSLLAAKLNPSIKVHTFEPSPGPFKYLEDNVSFNKLEQNITLYKLALSNSEEMLEFNVIENKKFPNYLNLSGEHNAGSKNLTSKTSSIQVKSSALDILYRLEKITDLDLIKIDVEGAEYPVIQGAIQLLKDCKPIIICELLTQKNASLVESKLNSIGYETYYYASKSLFKLEKIVVDERYKTDYFFIHPEKNILY